MSKHLIYHMNLNTETENFGGREWIVDGDMGRWNYPGSWSAEAVQQYYTDGIAFNRVEVKKMTRKECEKTIIDLLGKIAEVCEEYKPDMRTILSISQKGQYLSAMSFYADGAGDDSEKIEKILDTVKFEDGTIKTDGKYIRRDGSVY